MIHLLFLFSLVEVVLGNPVWTEEDNIIKFTEIVDSPNYNGNDWHYEQN